MALTNQVELVLARLIAQVAVAELVVAERFGQALGLLVEAAMLADSGLNHRAVERLR